MVQRYDRFATLGRVVLIGTLIVAFIGGCWFAKRAIQVEKKMSSLQTELSKEVFRFHVLADSDKEEAQQVKLKVRDHVLQYMKTNMPENEENISASETRQWALKHTGELQRIAEDVVQKEGYSYPAKVEVVTCYFPEKRYGEIVFPKGYYDALRIRLGNAKGKNWWCCLYPNLCLMSATKAVVDEKGEERLKEALTAEEFEMVTKTADFKVKCLLWDKYLEWSSKNEKK